jgi:hypothetical protein
MTRFSIVSARSRVVIEVQSTLQRLELESTQLSGEVATEVEHDRILAAGATGWFAVPSSSFASGNWLVDRDVRVMFEVRKFPEIRGDLIEVKTADGNGNYWVRGNLRLRGVTREVSGHASLVEMSDHHVVFEGAMTLDYTPFNLNPAQAPDAARGARGGDPRARLCGARVVSGPADRIEPLLAELEKSLAPGHFASVEELVRCIVALYGEGLARIPALLAGEGAAGTALWRRLAADERIAGLLALHGLHPEPLASASSAASRRCARSSARTAATSISSRSTRVRRRAAAARRHLRRLSRVERDAAARWSATRSAPRRPRWPRSRSTMRKTSRRPALHEVRGLTVSAPRTADVLRRSPRRAGRRGGGAMRSVQVAARGRASPSRRSSRAGACSARARRARCSSTTAARRRAASSACRPSAAACATCASAPTSGSGSRSRCGSRSLREQRVQRGRRVLPGPAGATESLLPLDAWREVVAANPVARTLERRRRGVLLRDREARRPSATSCRSTSVMR